MAKTKSDLTEDDPPAEPAPLPKSQDELDLSGDEIITSVSRHLFLPPYDVQVAIDHSNHHHSRLNTNVSAYAKVAGRDWTFYIKRLRTNIGRPPEGYIPDTSRPEPFTTAMSNEGVGEQLPAEATEPSRIHIDVGPNKLVSRLHAVIFFDSERSRWMIEVNGRNGIKINDISVRKGQEFELYSGCVFEVAGVEMMFILPENETQPLRIADKYLQRAGLIQSDPVQENMPPSGNFLAAANKAKALGQLGQNGQPLLAPAPPDYRRPDTPAKQRVRGPTVPASSPAFAGGITGGAVFHAEAIDYQDEATRHIKPAFTYGQLISQAIMQADNEQATLNEIYEYMKRNYSHYRRPEFFKGWQNSIRHNLSLNPGFKVRQRGPEDTGKGGYWCFVAETRDQMVADAWGPKSARKSPPKRRSGSATTPGNSPRAPKRGVSHNPGEADGGSPSRKVKRSPNSPAAAPRGAPQKQEDRTPERLQLPKPRKSLTDLTSTTDRDGSPTPRNRGNGARRGSQVFGLSDAAVGSPVLSSSFDPGDGTNVNLMTPAPVKRHPHLAPPSTAQRPSQHMPTSSPAPFWRFADTLGGTTPSLSLGKVLGGAEGTDRGGRYDMSPLRGMGGGGGLGGMEGLQSSSPAPQRHRSSRPGSKEGLGDEDTEVKEKDEESDGEEPHFDLTR